MTTPARERFNWQDQPEAAGVLSESDFENPTDADYGQPGYPVIGPVPPRMTREQLDRDRGVILRTEPEPAPAKRRTRPGLAAARKNAAAAAKRSRAS